MSSLSVQARATTLYGSGASIGDTSLKLSGFSDIYGNVLALADFGTVGYGTIEPGTSNEESITFTGVTNNGDGSFTLTGVKHVLAKSPFTQTSGLTLGHSGGTRFVISNTSAFYNDIKAYVDAAVVSGAPDATLVLKGLSELATDAELQAGTATGSSGPLFAGGASHTQTPTANKIPVATSGGKLAVGWIDSIDVIPASFKLGGVAATGTMALVNEATDFFNATAITGAQANTLIGGGDATALHNHGSTADKIYNFFDNSTTATTLTVTCGFRPRAIIAQSVAWPSRGTAMITTGGSVTQNGQYGTAYIAGICGDAGGSNIITVDTVTATSFRLNKAGANRYDISLIVLGY